MPPPSDDSTYAAGGTSAEFIVSGARSETGAEAAGTLRGAESGEEEDWFRPGRKTETNTTYRWIEAIRTGQAGLTPNFEDGWRAQQVIDAVIEASADRRWVDVGE